MYQGLRDVQKYLLYSTRVDSTLFYYSTTLLLLYKIENLTCEFSYFSPCFVSCKFTEKSQELSPALIKTVKSKPVYRTIAQEIFR